MRIRIPILSFGRPSKEDTLQRMHAWLASEGLKATCQAMESEAPHVKFFGQVPPPGSASLLSWNARRSDLKTRKPD